MHVRDPSGQERRTLGSHARQLRSDTRALVAEIASTRADLEGALADNARQRPYLTLTAAAGVGYVLGGGLRSQFTVVILGVAARLVTAIAVRQLGELAGRAQSSPRPQPSSTGT
ncbi:MAG: hypothetical protein ABR587_02310 [Candidatus Binatia bacterium]